MDAMDITWILMAPTSKWGYENIRHRQSIGMYFLILAHMEVFSELSAGWINELTLKIQKTWTEVVKSFLLISLLNDIRFAVW